MLTVLISVWGTYRLPALFPLWIIMQLFSDNTKTVKCQYALNGFYTYNNDVHKNDYNIKEALQS